MPYLKQSSAVYSVRQSDTVHSLSVTANFCFWLPGMVWEEKEGRGNSAAYLLFEIKWYTRNCSLIYRMDVIIN